MQLNWIAFAPVTGAAARFYEVPALSIGLLSMVFMLVFIVLAIPASYVIDTYGIRVGVGIGAVLTGGFGAWRGFASSYEMVLITQIGMAAGQPFVLNAITKVGARWFPLHERATAAAIPALAQFIGISVAMAITPILVRRSSITGMLQIYGLVSLGVALATLVFLRERPPTPPSQVDQAERFTVFAGIKHIFRQRDMAILLVLFFVNLGMFNAISTWIEQILAPRGFTAQQAGVTGAVMVGSGVLGAAIFPILSDRLRQRKRFLVIAVAGMAPGLLGLALASRYWLLLASSGCFGFFLMSAYPIGMQYSAEVSHPAPESTSQGLIILAGQISGVLFIFGMDAFKADTGSMSGSMLVFVGLTAIVIALTTRLRESEMIRAESSPAVASRIR